MMSQDIRKFFQTEQTSVSTKSPNKYIIYTDGSTINNGQKNSKGGIGIYFENLDIESIGEAYSYNGKSTNNICELGAILRAIKETIKYTSFKNKDKIVIYTDSSYSRNCIVTWSNSWQKNGWKRYNKNKKQKETVKNVELIKEIKELYDKYNIEIIHTRAHQTEPRDIEKTSQEYLEWFGNNEADRLANIGSN